MTKFRDTPAGAVLFHRQRRDLPPLQRSALRRVAAANCLLVARRVADDLREVSSTALADSTRVVYTSHLAGFREFASLIGLDILSFGLPVAQGGYSDEEEETILAAYAVWVWRNPRRGKKKFNTGRHCQSCVGAVRDWFHANYRRVIAPAETSRFLAQTLKSLRKRAPSGQRAPREPILPHHLDAVRALLDLAGNPRHRVYWAFILTAWQGVKRCGDLIAPKAITGRPWDPARCLHRGRATMVPARDALGRVVGRSVLIDNIPNKVNPTGEKKDETYLPVDASPGALSAAVAILAMLRADPRPGPEDQIPLFVDPGTGLELTYAAVAAFLDYWLTEAGFPELATGTHALRAGGATCVANLCADGSLLAGLMGNWSSSAKYQYVWSMRHLLEGAAREIGRARTVPLALAARSGPVGTYAAGRVPRRWLCSGRALGLSVCLFCVPFAGLFLV